MEEYKDKQPHPEACHPEITTIASLVLFPPVILHVYLDGSMASLQGGGST